MSEYDADTIVEIAFLIFRNRPSQDRKRLFLLFFDAAF